MGHIPIAVCDRMAHARHAAGHNLPHIYNVDEVIPAVLASSIKFSTKGGVAAVILFSTDPAMKELATDMLRPGGMLMVAFAPVDGFEVDAAALVDGTYRIGFANSGSMLGMRELVRFVASTGVVPDVAFRTLDEIVDVYNGTPDLVQGISLCCTFETILE